MRYILFFLFLLINLSIYSQDTAQFKGWGVDLESKNPISNVVVLVVSKNIAQLTDSIGQFKFGYLPPGSYSILFRSPGYKDYKIEKLELRAGIITICTPKMIPLTRDDFPKEFWKKKKKRISN